MLFSQLVRWHPCFPCFNQLVPINNVVFLLRVLPSLVFLEDAGLRKDEFDSSGSGLGGAKLEKLSKLVGGVASARAKAISVVALMALLV